MELQALLVLCGVGVTGIAVLLLMGLFSASGTTYEEAIAQQRRATSELLALAENKTKSKKTNKKANKKQAKKEKNKDNAILTTGSEVDSEAQAESGVEDDVVPSKPHVDFLPPVVVELPLDEPPNVKIRKRGGKDSKVKPILLNKEDPSCISDPSSASTLPVNVSNHFEEMQPKDEFELMHSTLAGEKAAEKKEEIVEKKENKIPKQVKNTKPVQKPVPVDVNKEEVSREQRPAVEAPQEQRKVKKVEKKNITEPAAPEEVVPPLNPPQPSELTTEKLLKQALSPPTPSPPPTKNKKKKAEQNVLSLMVSDNGGVAVSELVRVVREAALSRTEVQILTDALLDKHHDPLPEHSEWSEGPNDPMQKLKKQLADKEKALADEIEASQALHAKLKELRTNLNNERGRAAAATRAGEQAATAARAELHTLQARLTRLLDDNRSLAQDKLLLQAKLSEESEAQAQRVQMEMHIQRLSETEAALMAQLGALQAEAGARALEAGQARCDAAAARDAAALAQQHAAELAQQLQEANRACGELEQQRQCAVHAEQLAQQELRAAQGRLTELQNEVQRLTSRAQAAETAAEKLKEDLEKQKQELNKEVTSLREQLSAASTELAELKQLSSISQNGVLLPNSDEQKAGELVRVEGAVSALREELAAAQRASADHQAQLAALRDTLAHHQAKNDELRTKNWKIMEALQTAEKALQTKGASPLPAQDTSQSIIKAQETQLSEVASILRSACPIAAPSCPPGQDWLQTFAENLKKELEKRETEKKQIESDLSRKLLDKESQRKQLESELQKSTLDKESSRKQFESEIQKQLLEKENARKKLEIELQKQLSEKESARKQLEVEMKKKLESSVASKQVKDVGSSANVDSRVKDLTAQNEQLQGLVDKYKKIIDDTEGVLSRLQRDVSAEEARWAQQLADKQRDLDTLRQRTVLQMQMKIDSLQAELKQAQARNQSNSFADLERFSEEKLMSGLSEKHDGGLYNATLPVEVEEK